MREATALRRRASFVVESLPEPIVAGFRVDGSFSVFFDQDPVYQFDNQGRLRRAYRDGLLYRTQGSTLAQLTRVRTAERTELHRQDLDSGGLRHFIKEMREFLTTFHNALESKSAEMLEEIPTQENVANDIIAAVSLVLQTTETLAPAFATRKK